ncbi:MAG: hypothetical protein M9962_02935 [Oligoflexia bacterium]|nr:hypothetical protein [Oligoflexia bacterium]
MIETLLSLFFLLLFAEFASANFKRLAPVLEAWDLSRKDAQLNQTKDKTNPFPWIGGWEKLAALVWALGVSAPLLSFSLACYLFLPDPKESANIILGAVMGSNIAGLTLAFGFILLTGQIKFFRIRSINSPVFLLIATIVFAHTCFDQNITPIEGSILLLIFVAYGFYFRNFSSEWKYYERAFTDRTLVESSEGFLPVLAVVCLGVGFFFISLVCSYKFVFALDSMVDRGQRDALKLGAHLVGFALSIPWIARSFLSSGESDSKRAMALSSISHSCLLNVLLLPAAASFLGAYSLNISLTSTYLPVLLICTGVYASTLLIEKENGGKLSLALVMFYIFYLGFGLIYP